MTTWPWPPPEDDGGAEHLCCGAGLPNHPLPSTQGGTIRLAAREGPAIIFIYPWTGRPGLANPPDWDAIPGAHGSTPEAEGFRDLYPEFANLGWAIYGMSSQETDDQRELAERLSLPFALLSDSGFAFSDALALPRFRTGGVTYLKRLTLAADDGRIEKIFYPVHPPGTHAAEVLAWLRSGRETP